MKIVVLDSYALNPGDLDWSHLKALGECTFYDRTATSDEAEIVKRIGDATVVLTNKTPISENVLNKVPTLKYIGVLATGYDVVDVEAANKAGIVVTNIPTYGTDAVAQFTFALLLEITSQVGLHSELVHAGKWSSNPDFTFWAKPLIELKDKTIGIVGFGRIAQAVAKMAHAFSMNVIFYNHRPKDHADWLKQVSLDDLFNQADIISLHVPQTPETTHLIDKNALAKMRDGVIIINTSRGKLLNDVDVAQGLNSGKILAVGVDVAPQEPIAADSPLLTAKNCFITPHIAWAPKEARARLLDIAVKNIQAFNDGKPQNTVNK